MSEQIVYLEGQYLPMVRLNSSLDHGVLYGDGSLKGSELRWAGLQIGPTYGTF